MTQASSELEREQRYIDRAYDCLEAAKEAAVRLRNLTVNGPGGTFQHRFERDVIEEQVHARLAQLELGDEAICFGRIDRVEGDRFYIGRVAVSDELQEPIVVDWRAPVAEPFYRATARQDMGLVRRRHFATRGRTLIGIEDELFGEGSLDVDGKLQGEGALLAALNQARSGQLRDIVATIQTEQDEIIRAPLAGVVVVQGGPGTGKTVVALHRVAYLLYTHRFPLEGQGVLMVGPNRLFLRYIAQVLPSLGETGVDQVVLADLVTAAKVEGRDRHEVARLKGDPRMATVLRRAVRQRQQRLRADVRIGYRSTFLTLTVADSDRIVTAARRRFRNHNAGRKFVEREVWQTLAGSAREPFDAGDVRATLRSTPEMRSTLEWMWPLLTPADLLHDLFGARGLVHQAADGVLSEAEWPLLVRTRVAPGDTPVFTLSDVALLDEAKHLLGPCKRDPDEVRTYGHIAVDEAQDLTPMDLRMLTRRSLNGSMTVVGDIAQATGALAPHGWSDVLAHLPSQRPANRRELTVGYRIPGRIMSLAARVLAVAAPDLDPPNAVRRGDGDLFVVRAAEQGLGHRVAAEVRASRDAMGPGSVGVVCPVSMVDLVSRALGVAGIAFGLATRRGLDDQVTVVPVNLAKGLELDAVVVVEPAAIVDEEVEGLRSLYVAVTRSTQRLTVVHERDLPECLRDDDRHELATASNGHAEGRLF